MTLPSYPYGYGAGLLLILSIGFPTTCRTKIKLQPCAFFVYLLHLWAGDVIIHFNIMFFSNLEKIAIAQVSFRMIAADGKVDHEERAITFPIWSKMQITEEHLREAGEMADLTSLSIIANMDSNKKRFVAALLGIIMAADGNIDEKELALWRLVSSMCNLPTMNLTECPDIIMEFAIE